MKSLLFVGLMVAMWSCKKDPIQYQFEGTITEDQTSVGLSDAKVSIYQKPFNNAVSGGFELAGSATTDQSGHFSIQFDREKITEFRVDVQKEGYFNQQISINSSQVSSENTNVLNYQMEAKSWAQFTIQDVVPASTSDQLQVIFYVYRHDCADCIKADYNYFDGIIDTTITYINNAGYYLKFTTVNVSGGQSATDSIYMTPFDTVSYSIIY